ncbi:RNA cytidine acetyltransferase-like isoform X2 [Dendronephthya gigantea]|nr:RNA cytidine acetyltransferase-like isoform X2 [Dendronephthya gigantea]
MVIDDRLNVLPISSQTLKITPLTPVTKEESVSPNDVELRELKSSLEDTPPVGVIVNCCKTLDQAKAVLKFIEAISEKTLRTTVALTAARGRGKSAALGLAMAAAIAFGYSNIFVTSPSPENLHTLFEFVFKGFDALDYQEHLDYELVQSTNPEFNKAVVRVNVFREHRQTIQYIHPGDSQKLGQAELVVVDEAAAIPLPLVKSLLGPYLVFLSSTINGYEGTGRSLSLKLISQLRVQSSGLGTRTTSESKNSNDTNTGSSASRILSEVSLNESIRYSPGDAVEDWLNHLLCLDATIVPKFSSGCPLPDACDLYYVNRDTLFSYHKASEVFLQRIMSLYVSSHYKNTPNDLQLLSDAPAHHIFCLLGPVDPAKKTLPEVFCVIQVCLEGEISKSSIMNSLARGKRASGDLIPWTISQQFNDYEFPSLSGGRIVRIATHPDYQGMGYGKRALQLLIQYYEGKIADLSESTVQPTDQEIQPTDLNESGDLLKETIGPRNNLPPLLLKLNERCAERLDYLGVSYGLTNDLLRFWKKSSFVPVYIRQTANELTGEHSCIMLRDLHHVDENGTSGWLLAFWTDFRRRFLSLLSFQFGLFSATLALSVLQNKVFVGSNQGLTQSELYSVLTKYDIKRLDMYSKNLVDYHLITDLLPAVSRLFFLQKTNFHLSGVQSAILMGIGLQHKTMEDLEKELQLPVSQLLGLFSRVIRKVVKNFNEILESAVESEMTKEKEIIMEPLAKDLNEELEEIAEEIKEKQKEKTEMLKSMDLSQYAIAGKDNDWNEALKGKGPSQMISIASDKPEKRKSLALEESTSSKNKRKKQKKVRTG